jgi:hypothetical protein
MLELILGILFGVFLGIIGLSAIILRNNAVPFEALREPPSELQPLQSTSHYSDWKEVVWSRIWNEWIHDELVRRQMAEVLTRVLNKDRPSCLAPITVVPNYSRLSLALSAPELVETAYPDQVKLLFSLHTRGEVTLDIQTKFSGIPLTVHAVARNLVGKAELHIPPGNNPLCTLCFSSQPHVSFALLAAPSFTSSLIRLNDVPFLGEYLEKRVHRAIREYLVVCSSFLPANYHKQHVYSRSVASICHSLIRNRWAAASVFLFQRRAHSACISCPRCTITGRRVLPVLALLRPPLLPFPI